MVATSSTILWAKRKEDYEVSGARSEKEMKLKVIITGATGMVGEGVLHECLQDSAISHVLVIGRKSCGNSHEKIKEILLPDLFDLSLAAPAMAGYDACFFCLGVSSVGMKEAEYTRLTYDLTINFAKTLRRHSPEITFCYVSGTGTDSSEKGTSMWARIKGKTENELMNLFARAYMFRPGYMHPTPGLKQVNKFYRYVSWLYPVFRYVLGKGSTLAELGRAMIHVVSRGSEKRVLEVKDLILLAKPN